MNACLHVFPGVIVKGCYFHYAQCLWRRIQGIGLSVSYRENADHRNWFPMLLAMPFVPVPHVKDAFQFVKNTAPDAPHVRYFNDYFDRTWMNGQYPIEMWNFFKYDGPRTNNHVEGYHTRLMRKAGKIHPNIFEVVELFSQEEAASLVSILQLQSGQPAPKHRKSTSTLMLVWTNLDWNTCYVTAELSRISVPLDT